MSGTISPKVLIHTFTHFLAVVTIFYAVIFFPLWTALLLIGMHQIHMRVLKRCFLTRLAYHYGVMRGFTYWEYVSYLFGVKKYKESGARIDTILKVSGMGILLTRVLFLAARSEVVAALLKG